MPHGVRAIEHHLQHVDNVPLLVSLYTDATPLSTMEMIRIFKRHGEVVLAMGSSGRMANQSIYSECDAAVSSNMSPPSGTDWGVPLVGDAASVIFGSDRSKVCAADVRLSHRLSGIGCLPIMQLQTFINLNAEAAARTQAAVAQASATAQVVQSPIAEAASSAASYDASGLSKTASHKLPQMRLSSLLSAIKTGRVLFLNLFQILAFSLIVSGGMGSWAMACLSTAVVGARQVPPPALDLVLLLAVVELPIIMLSLLQTMDRYTDAVMSLTPRYTYSNPNPNPTPTPIPNPNPTPTPNPNPIPENGDWCASRKLRIGFSHTCLHV